PADPATTVAGRASLHRIEAWPRLLHQTAQWPSVETVGGLGRAGVLPRAAWLARKCYVRPRHHRVRGSATPFAVTTATTASSTSAAAVSCEGTPAADSLEPSSRRAVAGRSLATRRRLTGCRAAARGSTPARPRPPTVSTEGH